MTVNFDLWSYNV